MSGKFFLRATIFFAFFLSNSLIFSKQQMIPDGKKRGNIAVRYDNLVFYGDFLEDIAGNSKLYLRDFLKNVEKYPRFFSSLAFGGIGYKLYEHEILGLKNTVAQFVRENKEVTLGVTLATVSALYLGRKKIFKKLFARLKGDSRPFIINQGGSNSSGDDTNISQFSKSAVRVYKPGEITTKFEDVAGLETAKEELGDILMFLKDSEKFNEIGAHIPKGVLLSGSPGNGKTLLARALAGEAECPFLYVNASEFIEAIVGVGAARVRSMFSIAKSLSPCIIFIDEIDAVARKRNGSGFGGDTELSQTLNQILGEMDGFEHNENPIVIIGATNRVDILDKAILRPGRFDRKIEINSPYIKDRYKILKVHFNKVKTESDLDIHKIARGTPGYSGADLANLVNEAALLTLRDGGIKVSMMKVEEARDNIDLGRETKGMNVTEDDLWKTAVHEAGHAITNVVLKNIEPLHKVTIVPRNGALGISFRMGEEKYSRFEEEIRDSIVVSLAGSVAEEILLDERGIGASSDLKKARYNATQMVMHYGMTEEFKDITFEHYINSEIHLPDALAMKLQEEVSKIIHDCRKIAMDIILERRAELDTLAKMLMEKGTIFGFEVYKLCGVEEPKIEFSLVGKSLER